MQNTNAWNSGNVHLIFPKQLFNVKLYHRYNNLNRWYGPSCLHYVAAGYNGF